MCFPYLNSLHTHLIEHMNAEIVLHTITDIGIALEWLKSTFLYVRICKNPSNYSEWENYTYMYNVYVMRQVWIGTI